MGYPVTNSFVNIQDFSLECVTKILIFLFLNQNIVVGTQKNGLNEMVLLSTQNMLKLMGKKIFTILL